MSLIASNTFPPVTRLASPVFTSPIPSAVVQSLTVILSAFAFAFPSTEVFNVLNVLLVAKSIFVTSIFVVPLVILVTFVSNSDKALVFA